MRSGVKTRVFPDGVHVKSYGKSRANIVSLQSIIRRNIADDAWTGWKRVRRPVSLLEAKPNFCSPVSRVLC
jgi:hypothetical protein